jgi:hypothetical protein
MERNYGALYAIIGAVFGGAVSMIMIWLGMEPSYFTVIMSQLICVGVGYMVGAKLKVMHCSKPSCTAVLHKHDENCPACGAAIRGTVHSPLQHMAAVEAIVSRSEPPPAGHTPGPEPVASGVEQRTT